MGDERVRIVDIAQELGLSTATVSNVIHGKTKKISDETVQRVQQLLEEKQYIPSMAGILLAQNDSRIIGVVVNDHEKYNGNVLEDPFISSSLNNLSREIESAGYFMMVKRTRQCGEIIRFASMWNMEGLVVIGFCDQDYQDLRSHMRIPFVVYDGCFKEETQICNLSIDNYDGGRQVGEHLKELGHRDILCISDNDVFMDFDRYKGVRDVIGTDTVRLLLIPMDKKERMAFYSSNLAIFKTYTAVFAVSDQYAIELMQFLQTNGIKIPQQLSVVGFDGIPLCEMVYPALTTISQDGKARAKLAVDCLKKLKSGDQIPQERVLPVQLIKRQSTQKNLQK